MNLSVSVDSLKISSLAGVEVLCHSLPSISFASGGDGVCVCVFAYKQVLCGFMDHLWTNLSTYISL